jgi:hypothetical protein
VGFGSLAVVFTNDDKYDDLKMDSADTAVVLSFAISAAVLAVRLMDWVGARGKAGPNQGRNLQ